jgi:anti-sigma B factor antagonist
METQDGRHPPGGTGPGSSKRPARIDQPADRNAAGEPRGQEPPPRSFSPDPFRILESRIDGHRVIAPCGELDLSNAAQLKARLAGRIDTVLDLSELSFMDSTGIHVLISTFHRAQAEAWEFTVRNAQPAVLRVIKLVGLDQHLGLKSQEGPEPRREEAKQPAPPA